MKVKKISEPNRQWHCPSCDDGPGAIDWCRGLQALMAHTKTKGRIWVKAHMALVQLLDKELRRRGTSVILVGEAFGKLKC